MRNSLGLLFVFTASAAFGQTCVFSISPTSGSFTATAGNDLINVSLVSGPSTCTRTATSNAPWITISFGSPGTGNGTVGYSVQANPFTVDRTGTITVAGLTFTVSQSAGSCTYSVSPATANVSATGATGSFNLTTAQNSCPWTAVSANPEWLNITSPASGSGSATIRYSAAANGTASTRSSTITVGSASFTVSQPGVCSFTLNPANAMAASTGGTGSVAVQASSNGCAWTAASNSDWLTLTGNTSGSGSGTVTYSAAPNTTGQDRAGSISIGGVGFSVFQSASTCAYTLSNSSLSVPAAGGQGSFLVTSSCAWTAATQNDWIIISSGASTGGSGTVTFLVGGNTSAQARVGAISVGPTVFAITQPGVACNVTLGAGAFSSPATGASGSVGVTATPGCSWTASTTASWITLANSSGAGEGQIGFTVAPNPTAQARSGVVTIANQKFTIAQDASQCGTSLTPGQATIPAAGGSASFNINTACSWNAVSAAPWITLQAPTTGIGNASVSFNVAANASSDPRTGSISISGSTFTIVQTGKNCTFAVTPSSLSVLGRGGRATAQVTGGKGCAWTPSADQGWLTIPAWSSIDGNGTVTISAEPNPTAAPRTATLAAGGQAIVVTQGPLEVFLISAAGVQNGASTAAGAIAPGEIVVIYGQGMGPAALAGAALSADGQHLATTVAQTQILFNGVAAPVIYAIDKQVAAVVPYGVAGRPTAELKVVNQGIESNALTLQVAATSPGIFTADNSGRGQAAVLNQDGSYNKATNTAQRNTIVQIFATGEGVTTPAGEDGKIAGPALPKPVGAVTVTIGGQPAAVVYAGAAPGAVAGLFQVNARIAANAATGAAVPILLRVGTAQSQTGATIAVR